MKKLAIVSVVELKLFIRNFFSIFFAFVFPVMMLLLFGFIYGNEPQEYFNGYGTVDISVPAYTCMVIGVTGLMSLPLTVAQYRERKILKRFMATPISPSDILISQVIVNFIMTIAGMILLVITAKLVFNLNFIGKFISTAAAFMLVLLSIFSLGLLIAGVSPNGKTANVIAYLVYFPMLFLSGATIPMELMPEGIIKVSKIFPLTYGVNLLKGVWLGGDFFSYGNEIIVLSVVLVLCAIISIWKFRWE